MNLLRALKKISKPEIPGSVTDLKRHCYRFERREICVDFSIQRIRGLDQSA
jgi:hypothetical protein